MKNIVFFTGSGISKESGIQTFRDAGEGLWENFSIEEVCTHEAILYNRNHVIDFYNMMRGQLLTKRPNPAHLAIAELEKNPDFNVRVVTQNVDDLHEKAGSTHITHLHGELMKLRSSRNEDAWVSTKEIPDLFEEEKLTQGGLPSITDVLGMFSISSIEFSKSKIFFTSH